MSDNRPLRVNLTVEGVSVTESGVEFNFADVENVRLLDDFAAQARARSIEADLQFIADLGDVREALERKILVNEIVRREGKA